MSYEGIPFSQGKLEPLLTQTYSQQVKVKVHQIEAEERP